VRYLKKGWDLKEFIEQLDSESSEYLGGRVFLPNDSLNSQNLYFVYSELTCSACVDYTFKTIREVFSVDFIAERVIIFLDSSNERLFNVLVSQNRLEGLHLFRASRMGLGFYGKVNPRPFFFTIDGNGSISTHHFVMQEFPERTQKYLEGLKHKQLIINP